MACWDNLSELMDKLSLQFSEQAALRIIDSCTDIEELKALTKQLMQAHFGCRQFIADLMLHQAEELRQQREAALAERRARGSTEASPGLKG